MTGLESLSKEQLMELVGIYARNIYALDGTWFQSIEQQLGMDAAMEHDCNAWRRFTQTEARRIKNFLKLPDNSGLEGLERALAIRFSALANPRVEILREGESLVYRVLECRVQAARHSKGMPYHPCSPVGMIEHELFARQIDSRIECEQLSCYPKVMDPTCACAWRFRLNE